MSAASNRMAMRIHNQNRKIIIWKQRWAFVLACLLVSAVVLLTSCDEHDPLDTDIHIGYVLCDDHQVMSLSEFKNTAHRNAVGVIFATATPERPALAVMLFEHEGIQFTNKIPLGCDTSGDYQAYDGYVNCVSMFNTLEEEVFTDTIPDPTPENPDNVKYVKRTEYYYSPLGQWVFDSHYHRQSDYIPSCAEARLLQQNVGTVNRVIMELIALGNTEAVPINVGTGEDDDDCWYWTSTEDADDDKNRAWLFSMATPGFQQTPKTECHKARAIVAINY